MKNWKELLNDLNTNGFERVKERITDYNVYPQSLYEKEGSYLFITRIEGEKRLVILNKGAVFSQFTGAEHNIDGYDVKLVELNHQNAVMLREIFSFTNPVSFGREGASLGLGDRLGIASPGHIQTVRGTGVRPVLAQQSKRELMLTGRSYQDVLDDVSWAVFQEGYEDGFGADGDHLKEKEDIKEVLKLGYSMITLDCSDYIDNQVTGMSPGEIEVKYQVLSSEIRETFEKEYLGKTFTIGNKELAFKQDELREIVLVYRKMLGFVKEVYSELIEPMDRSIDFEVSIDETETPTTPQAHYFVVNELKKSGIEVNSLAPRFCGEFQKGIDYIGNLQQFEQEFEIHALIADHFGYKMSIHSGSDKFSVFPIIGKYTAGRVHVKTAGTNWLEAMKVIASKEPRLYRRIHQYALDNFEEATRYYHVTTDLDNIPDLSELADEDLPSLFDNNDGRQLIHITYGLILQAREGGNYLFRDQLYEVWDRYEAEYSQHLFEHIGRHIKELGVN